MVEATASLTLEELALFNELLASKFGLHFPEHKLEILESRLQPRLFANRLHRFMDYYLLLQYDLKRELDPLTRAITNNESYFFRETSQFEALDNHLLDELSQGGRAGKLRFLSAGCSSGEEPYTLNIFLRGFPAALGKDTLRIDGIDIDNQRLEMAELAVYRPTSLRVLNQQQCSRYFASRSGAGGAGFELRPAFRRGVRFSRGNILDPASYPSSEPYDAVFCRNVLIYFSETGLKAAIENFARAVRIGGLLFLGHSESIIGLTKAFQAERFGQCIAYRRKDS
ncbi:MAG: protein-glutamate O-methyltransferase CheR [bacterium]|nr:protein-glutamate O-methyltransferase CheR [bacterium]